MYKGNIGDFVTKLADYVNRNYPRVNITVRKSYAYKDRYYIFDSVDADILGAEYVNDDNNLEQKAYIIVNNILKKAGYDTKRFG